MNANSILALLSLFILSYIIAAGFAAVVIWRLRFYNGESSWARYIAFLEFAIFFQGTLELVGTIFGYHIIPVPSFGLTFCLFVGHGVLSVAQWAFLFAIFRVKKKYEISTSSVCSPN